MKKNLIVTVVTALVLLVSVSGFSGAIPAKLVTTVTLINNGVGLTKNDSDDRWLSYKFTGASNAVCSHGMIQLPARKGLSVAVQSTKPGCAQNFVILSYGKKESTPVDNYWANCQLIDIGSLNPNLIVGSAVGGAKGLKCYAG